MCLAFGQLTFRESLRDIETCLRALGPKRYHAGFRGPISRTTLADANRTHDWRIYADFAQVLITRAKELYARDSLSVALEQTVYALKSTGLRSDQTIMLAGVKSSQLHPEPLRRVSFYDAEKRRRFVFLTNNFTLPALTITALSKCRWQVELFFKWIKQHLRIKAFSGTTPNAVKTQVWIAISVYVLVAIVKRELRIDRSPYEILQILSLTLFEKTPIFEALTAEKARDPEPSNCNQLTLFDL